MTDAEAAPNTINRRASRRKVRTSDGLRTIDVVVMALANLGGGTKSVDIEDVAIEAYRLAPHRFGWRRHPDQIDLAGVRDGLSDARKPENGELAVGDRKHGWSLTPTGVAKADALRPRFAIELDRDRVRLDRSVRTAERLRVLRSRAFAKVEAGRLDEITPNEVRELLRIDNSATPEKYRQRVSIVVNAFADEPTIRMAIEELERRLREGELAS